MAEAWVATFKSELVDGRLAPATSTPSTKRCTGSASTTTSGCTKSSVTLPPAEYDELNTKQTTAEAWLPDKGASTKPRALQSLAA
jgi:hypothetical protein